jgi:hypothetical protein
MTGMLIAIVLLSSVAGAETTYTVKLHPSKMREFRLPKEHVLYQVVGRRLFLQINKRQVSARDLGATNEKTRLVTSDRNIQYFIAAENGLLLIKQVNGPLVAFANGKRKVLISPMGPDHCAVARNGSLIVYRKADRIRSLVPRTSLSRDLVKAPYKKARSPLEFGRELTLM